MNKVYIILVNWNGWRDTLECLESVFRLDYPEFRVIVCDNDSSDGSSEMIRKWAEGAVDVFVPASSKLKDHSRPPVTKPLSFCEYDRKEAEGGGIISEDAHLVLIRNRSNLGFAGGNNVGLRYAIARGDMAFSWLLNNDTVVEPSSLSYLVRRMQEKPGSGMCGSTLLHYENPLKVQALGGGWYCKWIGLPWHQGRLKKASDPINSARVERWMNYVVGASMLVSASFLEDIGLMGEEYFLFFEEVDWAIRARGRYTLSYAPKSIVYHKVGGSIGTSTNPRAKSLMCEYFNIRNRLLFSSRFFTFALPSVVLVIMGEAILRALLLMPNRCLLLLTIVRDFVFCRDRFIAQSSTGGVCKEKNLKY